MLRFEDKDHAVSYVEAELAAAVPSGWTFGRPDKRKTFWEISPTKTDFTRDFKLIVTDGLERIVLTYGNCDIGIGSLDQDFQSARTMTVRSLDRYPLGDCT